jgi:hypothetical protein
MAYWKIWEIDAQEREPGEEATCFFVGQFEGRTADEARTTAVQDQGEPNPGTVWAAARVPVSQDPAL